MRMSRRRFMAVGAMALSAGSLLPACADAGNEPADSGAGDTVSEPGGWFMPAEESAHAGTWMCWPSSARVWGRDLPGVQDAIGRIAMAIAEFEPVFMLARRGEVAALRDLVGSDMELIEAPVDDLWARDTLPCFLVREDADQQRALAAGRVRFNGWGGKQIHSGDTLLAKLTADHLGVPLIESGLVGEGGGIEVDGAGTVMAAASSWVNDNRNKGKNRDQIELALLELLGANRMIWIEGLAGRDITDGHIDTLARFTDTRTIVVDTPAIDDSGDPWVEVSAQTLNRVRNARTADGAPYDVVEVVQPTSPRGEGSEFLATYMNYYVCNGAVIAPQFGDVVADASAREVLAENFPGREIVMLDTDALAAGGGGIHCATQQQPSTR